VTLDSILKELVSSVDGATGVIVVAFDGESVQCYSTNDSGERLQLRGAYVSVVMQDLRKSASQAGLGALMHLVVEYETANLVTQEIDDDCFAVLELSAGTNIGEAIYRLRKSKSILRDEINL
jgi:predicted regulator of Ras-like GTPase activity (Roadblock/LC7/MglB family)